MRRWRLILAHAARAYGSDHCSSFAAAMAYYALLSLFPLAIFAVSLAGYVLRDPSIQDRILDAVVDNLSISEAGRRALKDALPAVKDLRTPFGLFGLVSLAYSGSALFTQVRRALGTVFRVGRGRPFVQGKLLDMAQVFGLGALLLVSVVLTAAITFAQSYSSHLFGNRLDTAVTVLFAVGTVAAPGMVSLGVFIFAYRVVAVAGLGWRDALPGALVAAVGFEALKLGFAQYVAHFGNYDAIYGTLSSVVAFMFFAYLSAQLFLIGAEIAHASMLAGRGALPRPALPATHPPTRLSRRIGALVKGLFVAPAAPVEPPPAAAPRERTPRDDPARG